MIIGLLGDHDESVVAHRAIPLAIERASCDLSLVARYEWIDSTEIETDRLSSLSGIWCVPASPYRDMEKVLGAIRHAREHDIPFLGTCGGYQHAALEFARNALGQARAGNAEVDAYTQMPMIAALTCQLREVADEILLDPDSNLAGIYRVTAIREEYHCGYGVNREYLPLFEGSEMRFTGFDVSGDPRALEMPAHRFFIGTAYQPERAALKNRSHPLVEAFLKAAGRL